ncbi:MAG: hypothetical protein NVS2B7_33560 [Herpetosiphon sp.]
MHYSFQRSLHNRRRMGSSFGFVALIAVLLAGGVTPATRAQAKDKRVLPQLHQQAQAQPNARFRVIVTRHNHDHNADDQAGQRGSKLKEMDGQDAFVAELSGTDLENLADDESVQYIAPDAAMQQTGVVDGLSLATLYPQAMTGPDLWGLGYTGAGIGVAVVDTGISNDNGDFNDGLGKSRIVGANNNSPSANANDFFGHGTHVAGIIAGNSWNAKDPTVQGKYLGMAPEANLINVKVSDNKGLSYLSDVVGGIEWIIRNRQTYNIRVMNLSLISSVAESAKTSTLDAAVERAWFNGIFVVVAAGNNGANTLLYPPANDPFVMTVGAADPMGSVSQRMHTVAPWSSYGTTQDGYNKPDVVAPGRYMASVLAPNSSFTTMFPERVVAPNYIMMSGSSMAAPAIAGVAAQAFGAHPEWTNDQLKWVMMNNTVTLGPGTWVTTAAGPQWVVTTPTPGQGTGEVDPDPVVRNTTIPLSANQNVPINVQLIGPGGARVYSGTPLATGATWATSSWTTSSWTTSSWTTSSWTTSSWTTANWTSATSNGAFVW